MLDLSLTAEQQSQLLEWHAFAEEVIRPVAAEHDRDESTPMEVLEEASRRGGGDAVAAGLLGPRVTDAAGSWLGDVVAVATAEIAVVQSRAEPLLARLVGHHGALTDDERLVPLLSTAR